MRTKIMTILIVSGLFLLGCGETSANVSGEAFLKTRGGSVITCAGNPVYIEKYNEAGYLVLTDLLKSRLKLLSSIKNSLTRGEKDSIILKNSISSSTILGDNHPLIVKAKNQLEVIETETIRLNKLEKSKLKEVSTLNSKLEKLPKTQIKETICNGQGNFTFTELQPGNYYISTTVQWSVAKQQQGGNVNKIIKLKSGDNKVVISM